MPKKFGKDAGSDLMSFNLMTHLHDAAPENTSESIVDPTLKHGTPHKSANALTTFLEPSNCLQTENSAHFMQDAKAIIASSSESVIGPMSPFAISS